MRPVSWPPGGHGTAWRRQLTHRMATLPAFSGCDRRGLRRLTQWGEVVEVEAGEILVREDRGDFWFFVVISGQIRLTRKGSAIGSVGPGEHFGHHAIVGLRPQHATAVTTETTTLLILGPRYVLSLLASYPRFQLALFPDVDPAEYLAFVKRMHEQATVEWHRIGPPPPARVATSASGADRRPGRPLTLHEAVARLAHLPVVEAPRPPRPLPTLTLPRWAWPAAGSAVAVLIALVLVAYHPPRAVVTPGRPIDVVHDIRVVGAPTFRPRGRYLLLWVHIRRPALGPYLADLARGQQSVPVAASGGRRARAAAQRLGRQQYLDSRRLAIASAESSLGLDGRRVTVTIRDRGFVGPSAGLVYALAVRDVLSGRDSTGGHTVAATGAVEPGGKVDPVGWVSVKVDGAARAGATVVLVPAGEEDQVAVSGLSVYPVANLGQALDALRRSAASS